MTLLAHFLLQIIRDIPLRQPDKGILDMTIKNISKDTSRRPFLRHEQDRALATEIRRIVPEIRSLIEAARHRVASSANLAMVRTYWSIGGIIVHKIRQNENRTRYGERLVEGLSSVLEREYGQGYSARNLWDMRRFFDSFQILQTVSAESLESHAPQATTMPRVGQLLIDLRTHLMLGWSHYRLLLSQDNPAKRQFYFEQAATQRWSVRELRRQINSALFERVALSRDARKLVALEKGKEPAEIVQQEDVFKDPYILDFLGLKGAYSEKDLESSIVRNLEAFLSELGTDFCFIARQYPMRIDDIDYFLDLLFYHRGLRCLIAIDLKLSAFTAADKGQMDLYLAWLKEHEWRASENEPIGLILCTSKRRQHVELLLRHGPHKMQVSEYLTHLPSKAALTERLKAYSRLLKANDNA